MHKLDDTSAFLIDEPLTASPDAIVSANDQRKLTVDLHYGLPFAHILELHEIYGEQEKTVHAKNTQPPIHSSVRESSPSGFQTMIGNPELRPAAVPPEQLNGTHQQAVTARGELALMRAVLSDAIGCYQKRFVTKNGRTQQTGNEAEAWFAANDAHWPFSFINICQALALDPDYIRRGLKLWRQHMSTLRAVEEQRQRLGDFLKRVSQAQATRIPNISPIWAVWECSGRIAQRV